MKICTTQSPIFQKNMEIFGNLGFVYFTKRRAPKFHAKPTDEGAEISHMRPI